jgi:hypothetical protein
MFKRDLWRSRLIPYFPSEIVIPRVAKKLTN